MNILNHLLVVVMLMILVPVSTNAGELNIPNKFSSGEKALSSEVNANFNAVKTEVDDNAGKINSLTTMVGTNASGILNLETNQAGASINLPVSGNPVNFTSTLTNIDSLTVPVPGPGVVVFNVSGMMGTRAHTGGTSDQISCSLASSDNSTTRPTAVLVVPGAIATNTDVFVVPMHISHAVTVAAAGSVTAYLNCKIDAGGGGQSAFVQSYEINAIYAPREL